MTFWPALPRARHFRATEYLALAAVIFDVLFSALLVFRPLPDHVMVLGGDIGLTAGLVLSALLCFGRPCRQPVAGKGHRYVPLLLGVAVLLGAFTAGLFAYYDLIVGRTIPPGTLADLTFVVAHPFALPTLLLLPASRTHGLQRVRVLLDALLTLAALLTFSTYFIIGPAMLHSHLSLFAKLSQAAYPISDLFLIMCMFVLLAHFTDSTMRPVAVLLALGLLSLATTDSIFVYQRLHDGYHAASLLDVGWLWGGTCVSLAGFSLRRVMNAGRRPGAPSRETVSAETGALHLSRSLIPFPLVVATILFTFFLWWRAANQQLALMVYAGAAIVVILALIRQFVAVLESSRLISRLKHLAAHDPLTGLANRTLFHDRLEQEIAGAQRRGTRLAVGVIDLDAFKDINDTFGHGLGDDLLRQVGRRLARTVREADTVARLGGDEFAIIFPGADEREASGGAARLLARINQPLLLGERVFEVDASLGIALYPEHGDDATALLQRADIAMYHAKRTNSGYTVYDPSYDHHNPLQATMTAELRRAIECGGLELYYQPKVSLSTRAVEGWEALVRWIHPAHGVIGPADFIPLAERTGLICPLTMWVLSAARQQWTAWYKHGQAAPIAVNLSPRSLFDGRVLAHIRELTSGPAGGSWLHLEITEGSLIADPEGAMRVLQQFHDLGIAAAIDDFGTGYSSLAYLKRLPVDEIKIDRSFVLDIDHEGDDRIIVRSIVDLAHHLGLTVTAEGVESQAAADLLWSMNCDLAQGYHFGRPLPASAIVVSPETAILAG